MLMTPKAARADFADRTQDSPVPAEPDILLKTDLLRRHGHIVVGDTALRCYKHKGRWVYDDRDVRRVAQALADFPMDADDTVAVRLPRYQEDRGSEEMDRADWRRKLVGWMFSAAWQKALDGQRSDEPTGDAWKTIGENGLPGGVTLAELIEEGSKHVHLRAIAGTRPLELLSWSGTAWLLPRAYADLLDRWQLVENELRRKARICTTCGAEGPLWGDWRTPTKDGYVTLCPACSGASYQPYTGHLHGVLYEALRNRPARADEYLCRLCGQSRASAWDHCHEHGYVRGPLCASCNTFEGKSLWFLEGEGSALHLLECRGCREQRTLPRKFHAEVIRAYLQESQRHGRCRTQPYVRWVHLEHGVHRFTLYCPTHYTAEWTKDVTVAEAVGLAQAFVDRALATGSSTVDGQVLEAYE